MKSTLAITSPLHAELVNKTRDPRLVYISSLSTEKSRKAMRAALERIAGLFGKSAEELPWASLRYQHTQAIRTSLVEEYSPATANHALAALRGVLREAARLELLSAEDLARAIDVRPARGERLPRGRALGADELAALLEACDLATAAGARDAAMLSVLYGCGLRRAELVALELEHVDEGALTVLGKGNKQRVAHLGDRQHLDRWLERRGHHAGPLFLPVDRLDRIVWRRLSDQAVAFILERLARRARVEAFSPHDLRRTFIGDLLDAGADISVVQGLAGHAQVTTTQRYDRRGEATKRRAAALLRIAPRPDPDPEPTR